MTRHVNGQGRHLDEAAFRDVLQRGVELGDGMNLRRLALAVLATTGFASAAHAACRIGMFGDLPLEPDPYRALVKGAVNGQSSLFILDTGAWASTISYADAQRYKVKVDGSAFVYTGVELKAEGVGGRQGVGAATFDMKLGSLELPREVMTAIPMRSLDHGAAALVGRDLLGQHDIELDMPDHEVRLVKITGCTPADLDYWNKPYSVAKLESDGSSRPAILVNVLLNGRPVPAMLDSGAEETTITEEAARLAGADLRTSADYGKVRGIGDGAISAKIAHFASFTLGDETIHDVNLVVSEMWKYNKLEQTGTRLGSEAHDTFQPRMLLGADFLSSHRVMVANSMGVVVFSYIGGPVFAAPQASQAAQKSAASGAPPPR
jgi:hypothetical protein